MWMESGDALRKQLYKTFGGEDIPAWMGGKGPNAPTKLYNDYVIDPAVMLPRFV